MPQWKKLLLTFYLDLVNQKYQGNLIMKKKLVAVEEKDAIRNFKNPITVDYIMEVYGIGPCNTIGLIKEYVKNAILDGVIGNNFEEADALMRQKASELGLSAR